MRQFSPGGRTRALKCPAQDAFLADDPYGQGLVACDSCGCRYHRPCVEIFVTRGCAGCGESPMRFSAEGTPQTAYRRPASVPFISNPRRPPAQQAHATAQNAESERAEAMLYPNIPLAPTSRLGQITLRLRVTTALKRARTVWLALSGLNSTSLAFKPAQAMNERTIALQPQSVWSAAR